MEEKFLTIFTPTYNREKNLRMLYDSLVKQTAKSFVWHIIDDGSEDNTENVVKSFVGNADFSIVYEKQENSGKYVAHNIGVIKCRTELFLCVDSDDFLLPQAVEHIQNIWKEEKEKAWICGILLPRMIEGKGGFRTNRKYGTLGELYGRKIFDADTMIVFRASIIKRFIFPVFNNEKFMEENVIYSRIDQFYRYRYDNTFLYVAEYLSDGLSLQIDKYHRQSPNATLYYYKNKAVYGYSFLERVKAYGCFLGFKEAFLLENSFEEIKIGFLICWMGRLLKEHYRTLFYRKYMRIQ